ncbi:hypothetical protein JZ751_015613 [Albula glossodonta]|uniref:Uncharacterized protein n=1 Tax=Albula glossodonta TaxID=121402 RepID=A0A8T2NUF7_9TELE|nr:hypothetical protein JZ751_015613 [Albula glossodonta]
MTEDFKLLDPHSSLERLSQLFGPTGWPMRTSGHSLVMAVWLGIAGERERDWEGGLERGAGLYSSTEPPTKRSWKPVANETHLKLVRRGTTHTRANPNHSLNSPGRRDGDHTCDRSHSHTGCWHDSSKNIHEEISLPPDNANPSIIKPPFIDLWFFINNPRAVFVALGEKSPLRSAAAHKAVECRCPAQRAAFLSIIPSCEILCTSSLFVSILALFQRAPHDKARASGICSADRMGQCEISEGPFCARRRVIKAPRRLQTHVRVSRRENSSKTDWIGRSKFHQDGWAPFGLDLLKVKDMFAYKAINYYGHTTGSGCVAFTAQ